MRETEVRGMAADSAEELFQAGNALFGAGDLVGAAARYRRALEAEPSFAAASFNLGCTLDALSGPAVALPHFEQAAALRPDWCQARGNLGLALARMGRMAQAAVELEAACSLDPGDPGIRNNLGLALSALGLGQEARASFQEAIRLNPRYPEAHSNLSILFERFGHGSEAITCCLEALRLNPDYPEAHQNLANALKSQGRHQEAIAHYREALRLNPGYSEAQSSLLFSLCYQAGVAEELVFAEHAAFGAAHRSTPKPHDNDPTPDRVLRIGYLSADFREHAVARFIEPVLRHHDRSRFRVFCYSNVSVPDQRSGSIAELAESFVNIAGVPDAAVEEIVRRDRIDILVDLSGHTAGNRLLLFAAKPAPVQVTWLGYPNSTGLQAIDYRITDAVCDPPGLTERFHTEELIRLPANFSCFSPPEEAPQVGELPLLGSGVVTFGSFNNPAKITPETVALWAGVLHAVARSRMLIKGYSLACLESRERLLAAFARHGITAGRLELLGNTPSYREHLALYGRVDIALDSFPYNGTTTSCEALWMGVPVVTLAGATHRSRVGASLLSSIGLSELAAGDARQFVEIAAALAHDTGRLQGLRGSLRRTMAASPLTDGAGFTRGLESALRDIWGRWCRRNPGLAPDQEALGSGFLRQGRLDEALGGFLAALRGGARSALGGIQATLNRQMAADLARTLAAEHPLAAPAPEPESIRAETLEDAAELLLAAGLVTPAELICRYLADRGDRSPGVHRTLGEIALCIGQPAMASREFQVAIGMGEPSRAARIGVVKAQESARLHAGAGAGERFLLIKAWGYGFWSDVNHLLGQLLLAEITGRTPVVHWGGNSLFSDDSGSNAFDSFFEPINGYTVQDLAAGRRSFYPPKWNAGNLAQASINQAEGPWSRCSSLYALERGEEVVVSDFHHAVNDLAPWIPAAHPLHGMGTDELCLYLFRRYLKVRPSIAAKAEAFFRQKMAGGAQLALHVRGGDKGGEDPGLSRLNALYHPAIERYLLQAPHAGLFLMTDDAQILSDYLGRYPDRVIHTGASRTRTAHGVHYQQHASRYLLAEEVIVDTLLALRCEAFIGNGLSNVSLAVAQMKGWAPGTCRLFGARLDRLRQLTLYRN